MNEDTNKHGGTPDAVYKMGVSKIADGGISKTIQILADAEMRRLSALNRERELKEDDLNTLALLLVLVSTLNGNITETKEILLGVDGELTGFSVVNSAYGEDSDKTQFGRLLVESGLGVRGLCIDLNLMPDVIPARMLSELHARIVDLIRHI